MGLFGRDESLRRLADAAIAAQDGYGGLLVVRADPGLGLSALLDAHAEAMRSTGLPVRRIAVLPPHGTTVLSEGVPPQWPESGVVVIDDLHRADDATLLALHDLAEELSGRSLLVVAGRHRGAAPERFTHFERTAAVHDLLPLDDASVHALLTELTGAEPSESLRRLAAGAAGNPWLLAQLTAENRAQTVTAWATGLAGSDAALLRFAAILADRACVEDLAAAVGSPPAEVLAGAERLAALGLAEVTDGVVRLRHAVVRDDVAATSAALRTTAAKALISRNAPPEAVVEQLVHAPVDAWLAAWLGRHAEKLAADPTPGLVDLLERAVAHLVPGDPDLLPLRAALAEAQLWSGRLDAAEHTARTTLMARPDAPVRRRSRAVLVLLRIGAMDPGGAAKALEPEREHGELPPRLAVLDALARLLVGDLTGVEHALDIAEPHAADDPVVALYLLNIKAIGRFVFRDLTGALELLDQADALLEIAASDRGQRLMTRLLRAVVQDLRQERAALETAAQARPLARELGTGLLVWLHTITALALFNNGHWDESLAEIEAATALPDLHGFDGPLHAIAIAILVHRGDLPAARAHAELAKGAEPRGVALFYEQITAIGHAVLADAEGDSQRALEIVRTLANGDVGVHNGHAVSTIGARIVRIAVGSGDRELAERVVAHMQELVTGDSLGERGALTYCQGLLDSDVDLLLDAAQQFAENGSPVTAARAAQDAAKVLAASGRSADARAAYRTAIERFTALAAAGEIHRADAELRAFGVRRGATGPRRRPKHGWESLTAAEHRVAELVAQGLTNREVAERLIVSVRTVDSHVSKILAKLGYASRVEIVLGFERRS
ncbi:regulatory protein, luxR family [Saccharopolyspora antimicrobica]|uniref:Regulatory LuxR family protein n=1 Tax=Saccharopolyspora antimicrobica TaxID=455193 RepID=A0A1I4TTU3_9PSEU|nr:helix-turn-helix transcriptional regulator [Saccharopolyspora antimicrobica]RKT88556.1 regulatory LuxR family protein [Saccharopolyspora antimicrobica]SFM80202.1 regulatory protein, luxR family [Saccharopolyspora antimicrobica]